MTRPFLLALLAVVGCQRDPTLHHEPRVGRCIGPDCSKDGRWCEPPPFRWARCSWDWSAVPMESTK